VKTIISILIVIAFFTVFILGWVYAVTLRIVLTGIVWLLNRLIYEIDIIMGNNIKWLGDKYNKI
jgi:hypothetical protein